MDVSALLPVIVSFIFKVPLVKLKEVPLAQVWGVEDVSD
jgi:hypothetical protein